MPAQKRTTWLDKVREKRGLLERLTREVDADDEPLSAIYRRYCVKRFCAARTFRVWGGERRAKIRRYEATRRRERYAAQGTVQAEPQRGGASERQQGTGAPGGDGPDPDRQQCGNTAGVLHAGPVPTASGR